MLEVITVFIRTYRVCGSYITVLFSHKLLGVCFSTTCFPLWTELPWSVSYQVCGSYIIMLFLYKLSGYIFFKNFFQQKNYFCMFQAKNSSGQKLRQCSELKLSRLRCLYYHAIYTSVTGVCFSTTLLHQVSNLPCFLYLSYHACIT